MVELNISITILYRPSQKGGKKPDVQHQATVKVVCRTQMEPKSFTVVRLSSIFPKSLEAVTSDCKVYRLHRSCRNEHLAHRDGHTDLWDWGLGGVKVRASGLNKMLKGSRVQHWDCETQRRGGSKTAASGAGQGFCQNQLPVYWWLTLFYSNYTNRTEGVISVADTCTIKIIAPESSRLCHRWQNLPGDNFGCVSAQQMFDFRDRNYFQYSEKYKNLFTLQKALHITLISCRSLSCFKWQVKWEIPRDCSLSTFLQTPEVQVNLYNAIE